MAASEARKRSGNYGHCVVLDGSTHVDPSDREPGMRASPEIARAFEKFCERGPSPSLERAHVIKREKAPGSPGHRPTSWLADSSYASSSDDGRRRTSPGAASRVKGSARVAQLHPHLACPMHSSFGGIPFRCVLLKVRRSSPPAITPGHYPALRGSDSSIMSQSPYFLRTASQACSTWTGRLPSN